MSDLHQETEQFWEKLLLWIEEGHIVPVVGQDLLEIPQDGGTVQFQEWLAPRLAARLGSSPDDVRDKLTLAAVVSGYLRRGRDLDDIYPAIRSIMPARGELPLPPALLKLAQIDGFRLFVTTTFDSLLRDAINHVRFDGREATREHAFSPESRGDLPADWSESKGPTVFHLLGRVSNMPGTYAVTDEDVLEFVRSLQSEARQPAHLLGELNRRYLLILGGHFPNWVLRFLLRIGKGERLWMARRQSWIADACLCADPELPRFLDDFRTRTSLFPQGGAVDFVEELHRRWVERHPPTMGAGTAAARERDVAQDERDAIERMPAGAVFLSYASEDRPAVDAIHNALEAAGMDVWFDRHRLRGGDDYEARIKANIGQASLFLPIISANTLTRDRRYFRLEWGHAERVARMASPTLAYVIPVAIDDTPVDHPALPEFLRERHWLLLDGGSPSAAFVAEIRARYRDYHRAASPS